MYNDDNKDDSNFDYKRMEDLSKEEIKARVQNRAEPAKKKSELRYDDNLQRSNLSIPDKTIGSIQSPNQIACSDEKEEEKFSPLDHLRTYFLSRPILFSLLSMPVYRENITSQYRMKYLSWLQWYLAFPDFICDSVWPLVFVILSVLDIAVYALYPEDRYGNTLLKILLGTSPNQLSLSSNLGTDLVMGEGGLGFLEFWVPFVLMWLPIIMYMGGIIFPVLSYCPTTRCGADKFNLIADDELDQLSIGLKLGWARDVWRGLWPWQSARQILHRAEFSILYGSLEEAEQNKILKRLILTAKRHSSFFQSEILSILANIADSSHVSSGVRKNAITALKGLTQSEEMTSFYKYNIFLQKYNSDNLYNYEGSFVFIKEPQPGLVWVNEEGNKIERLKSDSNKLNEIVGGLKFDNSLNKLNKYELDFMPENYANQQDFKYEKNKIYLRYVNPCLIKYTLIHHQYSERLVTDQLTQSKIKAVFGSRASDFIAAVMMRNMNVLHEFLPDILTITTDREQTIEQEILTPEDYKVLNSLISSNPGKSSFYIRAKANYLLWTLNQHQSFFANVYFIITLIKWAIKIRYLSMAIFKMMGVVNYFKEQAACTSAGMIFKYMDQIGNYDCMVCPDWDFVSFKNRYASEGCFNGLMAASFSSQEIIAKLKYLNNQFPLTLFKLNEAWPTWDKLDLETILNYFSTISLQSIQTLNFSCSPFGGVAPSTSLIQVISSFIQRVNAQNIDFGNCSIEGGEIQLILSDIVNKTTEYINFAYGHLGDKGATAIGSMLPALPFLKTLVVAGNQITNNGFQNLTMGLVNSTVSEFDVSNNLINDMGVTFFASLVQYTRLMILSLSNNPISTPGLVILFKKLSQTLIKEIAIAGGSFGDVGVSAIIPYLQKTLLTVIDLSNNELTARSGTRFFSSVLNSTISSVIVANNQLGDQWANSVTNVLSSASQNAAYALRSIDISGNGITSVGFGPLIKCLINGTQLEAIIAGDNQLGGGWIPEFALSMQSYVNNTLRDINLFNIGLRDTNALQFFDVLTFMNVTVLRLASNMLSSNIIPQVTRLIVRKTLKLLDLSDNNIDETSMSELGEAIPDSSLELIDLSRNPVGDNGGTQLAVQQLPLTPHRDSLGDVSLSIDQSRLLSETNLVTPLVSIILNEAQMGNTAMRAFCRLVTVTQNKIVDLQLNRNLNDPFAINSQSCQISDAVRQFQLNPCLLIYAFYCLAKFIIEHKPTDSRKLMINAHYIRSFFNPLLSRDEKLERISTMNKQNHYDFDKLNVVSANALRFT